MPFQRFNSRLRASCAPAVLCITALLPIACITASKAEAQATQLPPVTVEKPKPKIAKAKPKPRQPVIAVSSQPSAAPQESASANQDNALAHPSSTASVLGETLAAKVPATSDTASLLSDVPGVAIYSNGGISGLPSIRGLEDDRVKILVDGAITSSACANHMNPPLSYVDPSQIKKIDVYAGATPVSVGGDNIGGTIVVETQPLAFAEPGEGVATHGTLSSFLRSNSHTFGGYAQASAATNNVAIGYSGSTVHADDYRDGNGDKILSSLYEAQSHTLTLAARDSTNLLTVDLGWQYLPYQGFPNAPMDMTENESWSLNAKYEGRFDWGKLNANAYYRNVDHEMNAIIPERSDFMAMLMRTHGENAGYQVKAEIPLSQRDTIRVGNEFAHQYLHDWWPEDGSGQDLIMLNGATRDRVGTFAEWEARWSKEWSTIVGVRNDVVWMNTGKVQGYWPDDTDADAFNARDRSKTDVNLDLSALTRYRPDDTSTYELGFARKTRSPSLYERYIWYNTWMVGWFGDGNGYMGNLDLTPETANTVSFTAGWRGKGKDAWEFKISPYYSYVQDYIDVDVTGSTVGGAITRLQFANHDAELYGADISGRYPLWNSSDLGRFSLTGVLGYVHGENLDTGDNLYHMMPLNAKLALEHKLGGWTNTIELQAVDDKTDVQAARKELPTPGYALVNLRSSYQFERLRFDFGVSNLFNQQYYNPLGGNNVAQWDYNFDWNKWPSVDPYRSLAGEGRSFYAGVTMKF